MNKKVKIQRMIMLNERKILGSLCQFNCFAFRLLPLSDSSIKSSVPRKLFSCKTSVNCYITARSKNMVRCLFVFLSFRNHRVWLIRPLIIIFIPLQNVSTAGDSNNFTESCNEFPDYLTIQLFILSYEYILKSLFKILCFEK